MPRTNPGAPATASTDVEAQRLEVQGEDDPVHRQVAYPPKVAVSNLVNRLKGVAGRLLRKERPDLEPRYWQGTLWSPSYWAGSGGSASTATIRQYIEQQRSPH